MAITNPTTTAADAKAPSIADFEVPIVNLSRLASIADTLLEKVLSDKGAERLPGAYWELLLTDHQAEDLAFIVAEVCARAKDLAEAIAEASEMRQ